MQTHLEASLVSFDGNTDGALGEGSNQLRVAVLGHVLEPGNGDGSALLLGRVACLVGHLVGVVGLRVQTLVLNDVLERKVHQPALHTGRGGTARSVRQMSAFLLVQDLQCVKSDRADDEKFLGQKAA